MTFKELNLIQPLLDSLTKAGYEKPSPIQEKAIPILLNHDDLVACAQTGTGKTAAFSLPILQLLKKEKEAKLRSLILSPTRELASQIFNNIKKYGRYLKLRVCCIYGGVPSGPQLKALKQGCDILVATPGRLIDYLDHAKIMLDDIEIFILDEADRMLDMGFINDVYRIIKELPHKRQTALFSATMPKEICQLAMNILHNPKEIHIAKQKITTDSVKQSLIFCRKADKKKILIAYLKADKIKKGVIFTRTKIGAERLAKYLSLENITSLVIHGDKTQGQRMNAMQRFRTNQIPFLIATDIVARGIDIQDISHVINYDLPEYIENYIHRIGRTGRAKKKGQAISLVCAEELSLLSRIEELIHYQIPKLANEYAIDLKRYQKTKYATKSKRPIKINKDKRKSLNSSLIPQKGIKRR